MRKSSNANNLQVRALVAVALLTLLAGVMAEAGERVKFKNGHSIVVESVRIEGDIVYLTTSDGSEAGFPKALVELVEEGHKTKSRPYLGNAKSPRSPGLTELFGYERAMRQAGRSNAMRITGVMTRDMAGQRLTAGFRYKGSVDVTEAARDSRPPQMSALDRGGGINELASDPAVESKPGPKKSSTPVLTPRVATSKKGKSDQ